MKLLWVDLETSGLDSYRDSTLEIAAILTTAIYVLEDFGNPALIAGVFTVLPTQAYGLISGFGDVTGAAVVSTILLLLALPVLSGAMIMLLFDRVLGIDG